jgi:hypothetical protein
MSFDPDTTRIVRSWLDEGVTQLPDRVLDGVLDQVRATPQRRATWWPARRLQSVNTLLKFGLAAAVVVAVAVFIGINTLGTSGTNVGGPGIGDASPTAEPTPEATLAPSPSSSVLTGIPGGPFVLTPTDYPVQITIDIASSGWEALPEVNAVAKDDDGLDPPESVGVALLGWAFPAGAGLYVYGDPCQWSTTTPATPATTPDEVAAALEAQASSDGTAPVDVTVGGYAGKAVTVHVPMTFDVPNATRDERFAVCDDSMFGFYGVEGEPGPVRNAQGAGQVDELWILDVDGAIVVIDATYAPAASADLVEELRTLAESATFEVP